MARTFDSQRLRHQRRMDQRLTADHRILARNIAALVLRAATARDESGAPIVPNSRAVRQRLNDAIWEQVLKPYYIGSGTDALRGAEPQSPYARLLVEGITEATRIQVQRQVAIVRRVVRDETVLQWLTGPRPFMAREMVPTFSGRIQELVGPSAAQTSALRGVDGRIDIERARGVLVQPRGMYEPFHAWVDPNGYRLSDRIWRTSIDVRSRIDRMMEYHISRGTSAVDIADALEPFLTPGALQQRTVRPYGTEGSYAARRLARTEITAAAGRATVNASAANPFVNQMQWRLSGSHPRIDICDTYARGGPNGDGVYPLGEVPPYPPHPHCLCSLLPVPAGDPAELVASLREDIQAARGNLLGAVGGRRARALQGILNPEYMQRAILSGNLDEAVAAAVQQSRNAGRLPVNVRARVPRVTRTAQVPPTGEAASEAEQARRRIIELSERTAGNPEEEQYNQLQARVKSINARQQELEAGWQANGYGGPNFDAQRQEFNDLMFDKHDAEQALKPLVANAEKRELARAAEYRKALAVENPTSLTVVSREAKMPKAWTSAMKEVSQMIDASVVPPQPIQMAATRGRGYYDRGVLFATKSAAKTESLTAHELGHWMEHKIPGVYDKAIAFRDSRTQGESTIHMGPGYGVDEYTKKDKFISSYMGKVYPGNADTEIVSMGIEFMYKDAAQLARQDPEYFDFIYNLLRGK